MKKVRPLSFCTNNSHHVKWNISETHQSSQLQAPCDFNFLDSFGGKTIDVSKAFLASEIEKSHAWPGTLRWSKRRTFPSSSVSCRSSAWLCQQPKRWRLDKTDMHAQFSMICMLPDCFGQCGSAAHVGEQHGPTVRHGQGLCLHLCTLVLSRSWFIPPVQDWAAEEGGCIRAHASYVMTRAGRTKNGRPRLWDVMRCPYI